MLRALDAWLSQRRIPFLKPVQFSSPSCSPRWATPGRPPHASLLDDCARPPRGATAGPLVAGCSAPLAAVESAPRCLQQARRGVHGRPPLSGRRAAPPFSTSSAATSSCSTGSTRRLCPTSSSARSAPLLEYDAAHRTSLYKTLYALFENHLAVQQTADELHIHRNTLQKRMAHVEELLGIDLSELDDIVDVRLGLQAAVLLGRQPA